MKKLLHKRKMQMLDNVQIQQFIEEGFVRLDDAFPTALAAECVQILWKDIPCHPDDPNTWTQPVIRLGDYDQEPFKKVANTPILHAAFNQLVGEGRWIPRNSLGTFPVRFPNHQEPNDTGWHVDASFPGDNPNDIFSWRINITSNGRALLMLFLFSDVEEQDAPTRIRVGSHLDTARIIAPAGEQGFSFKELAGHLHFTANRKEVLATGKAGTVYLCHPFLAHGAQPHYGTKPRFMAQPPLYPVTSFQLQRTDNNYCPVETAIRLALGLQAES